MSSETTESVLVVVEGSAACPLWMSHWGEEPADGWSMLEQEEWEPKEAFADRLDATLARCRMMADVGDTIVMVVGQGESDAATVARWRAAATVLTHLTQVGGGKLFLTRGYGFDGKPDAALAALARDLAEEWEGSGLEIGVRPAQTVRAPLRKISSIPAPRQSEAPAFA